MIEMAGREVHAIAYIRSDFPEKFGIPRQSGLVETESRIVFTPEFRTPDAIRGIEGFDYLWLLWELEEPKKEGWSALVRPPRLGGKETVGVFASRSPYRPNGIGLSCVRLLRVEQTAEGAVLVIQGADLRDRTAILDIKPYLPYADSHPDARASFADQAPKEELTVCFPETLLERFPAEQRAHVKKLLALDPRPRYGYREESRYGMAYAGKNIVFSVSDQTLTVLDVTEYGTKKTK